ncbi:hypothetical protein [Rhizorhapis sp. SPR117]|uniref:hypothetical protein n=1 Tax=Rhizorhapis sp. SPR117 TaxID=2912611 RepID=UPI001F414D62|nr:hypothetical protein [Rhizorhapis sp. SPR117]
MIAQNDTDGARLIDTCVLQKALELSSRLGDGARRPPLSFEVDEVDIRRIGQERSDFADIFIGRNGISWGHDHSGILPPALW